MGRQQWGLRIYEQDWLNEQYQKASILRHDPEMARQWLLQMDHGASKNSLSIQYCMCNPRHLLQSLETTMVTQARASDDYHPDNYDWRVGFTSHYLHAIGLAPSKDNFWTNVDETGNKYHRRETNYRLHASTCVLSTGPVAFADKIGSWQRDIVMKSCREDGRLMQPDTPLMLMDKWFT